jgi:hypothetical protein
MNSLGLIIVGVIVLIVAYYAPIAPSPLRTILNIVGWILVAVGAILLLAFLLGIPVAFGAVR